MLECMKRQYVQVLAWLISLTATVIAVAAWGQGNHWQLASLSTYQLFPLFGLLAFSLMWSHYIAAALRHLFKIERAALKTYFEVTSLAVLAAILLHPGLLAWQLWRDGLGLPPGSELRYVTPDYKAYIIIAMVSLLVFLTYEFRRAFHNRPWWRFVQYASDGAMILILLHSLKLGSQLQTGWLKPIWYFYGATFLCAISYSYYKRFQVVK